MSIAATIATIYTLVCMVRAEVLPRIKVALPRPRYIMIHRLPTCSLERY